jgi:hypothetical protein
VRDVYACSFNLRPSGRGDDGLSLAAALALEWVFARHHPGASPDANLERGVWEEGPNRAEWQMLQVPLHPDRLWSLTYSHPDASDQTLAWRTTVQLAEERAAARFTLRLAIEPTEMRVAPANFAVWRPQLVKMIAERFDGEIDGRPVSYWPTQVTTDTTPDLVALMLDPRRRLPVVVASVDPRLGRPSVDVRALADRLTGIAHTFAFATGEGAWELTRRLGDQRLSVFQGAVRVYWPGFDIAANPYDHRLWMPERIEAFDSSRQSFVERISRLVSSVAVLRVPADPLARRLLRVADERIQAELAEYRARPADALDPEFAQELVDEVSRLVDVNRIQAREIERLTDEVEAKDRNFAEMAREYGMAAVVEPHVEEEAEIQTLLDAVDRAERDYADCLVFLPEARESADGWTYPNVTKFAYALQSIGEIARRWQRDQLPAGFAGAFQEAGLEYDPDVAVTTVGRTGREYIRRYKGRDITLGPHVGLGRGTSAGNLARIYWWVDEAEQRFVIGHAGRHLRDTTT